MWWIIGILSIPYALKMLKDDTQSMKTDIKTTVIDNEQINQKNIKDNFNNICKAVGIKLDKKGRPIKKDQYLLGVEFLQYKGHSDETIDVFYNIFMDKYDNKLTEENQDIKDREAIIKNASKTNIMVFRHDYYGDMEAEKRLDILNQQTWGKMVYQYRYIHGMNSSAKFTEVWTLKVPIEFRRKDLKRLYKDSCISAEIDFGDFRGY